MIINSNKLEKNISKQDLANILYINLDKSCSEFSIDELVGVWNHNDGSTIVCVKISETKLSCQFESLTGLVRIVEYHDSIDKFRFGNEVISPPTITSDNSRDHLVDWKNGNVWREPGKYSPIQYDGGRLNSPFLV